MFFLDTRTEDHALFCLFLGVFLTSWIDCADGLGMPCSEEGICGSAKEDRYGLRKKIDVVWYDTIPYDVI